MRRSIILGVVAALTMLLTALPAGADYPPEVIVDPGELVEVIDGIYITVEPNGTVSIIDGVFVEKFSNGGQPLTISVRSQTEAAAFTIIPGGCLDPKGCQ